MTQGVPQEKVGLQRFLSVEVGVCYELVTFLKEAGASPSLYLAMAPVKGGSVSGFAFGSLLFHTEQRGWWLL